MPAVAAPLPQDVHAPVAARAAPTERVVTPNSASVNIAAESQVEEAEFPSFFAVSAEPDMAVLSDPSRQGSELRRVAKVSGTLCIQSPLSSQLICVCIPRALFYL